MSPAIAIVAFLALLAGALRPLKHPLYFLHIAWCGTVVWVLEAISVLPSDFSASQIPSLLLVHLLVVNCVTFIGYGYDKYAALQGGWRVPEKTFYSLILLGGNAGAYLGSRNFRHKTKKTSFRQMALAVNILQLVIVCALFFVL